MIRRDRVELPAEPSRCRPAGIAGSRAESAGPAKYRIWRGERGLTMRKFGWMLLVSNVLALGLASGVGGASPRALKVRMDSRYQGYHAPFFVAVDKGYYAAAGLNVEVLFGQGSSTGAKIVASGTEEFGLMDAGVAALAISKGAPLRVVAGIIQKNPTVVISWNDHPVKHPKDMQGKRLAWIQGAATGFVLTAMWRANGVDEAAIRKISTTREAGDSLFLERKADFATGFVNSTWASFLAKGVGKDMSIMLASDWGVNALSLGIVVNTGLLDKEPQVVQAFVEATLRGLKDVLANPEMGWRTVVKYKPEVDLEFARLSLESTLPLLHTSHTKGKPLGWMSEQDWEATLDFLASYLGLSPRLPLDRYYSNEFLPKG